ncbi:hypothetical protein AC625_10375 [Peribacillus loiseleuriae]|uniref:Uncharacterized protein n=1 Tax=Peribacillus loiseleuriae TaxID=1679170 RepID=A0A0K9H185_9BACI|nr:hypothetical protein AC625_10375 [Peribacillus loiseleuriae]
MDLTNDWKKEVVVFYTEGTGTGLSLGKVHIINPTNFKELKIESLDEIIKKHIQSKVEKYDDRVEVKEEDNRTPEESELIKLRKEIQRLLMENYILKQAALIIGRK